MPSLSKSVAGAPPGHCDVEVDDVVVDDVLVVLVVVSHPLHVLSQSPGCMPSQRPGCDAMNWQVTRSSLFSIPMHRCVVLDVVEVVELLEVLDVEVLVVTVVLEEVDVVVLVDTHPPQEARHDTANELHSPLTTTVRHRFAGNKSVLFAHGSYVVVVDVVDDVVVVVDVGVEEVVDDVVVVVEVVVDVVSVVDVVVDVVDVVVLEVVDVVGSQPLQVLAQ